MTSGVISDETHQPADDNEQRHAIVEDAALGSEEVTIDEYSTSSGSSYGHSAALGGVGVSAAHHPLRAFLQALAARQCPPCLQPRPVVTLVPRTDVCRGLAATIVGTDGTDIIIGTSGPDVIHGRRGNDVIRGLRGNDVICGARARTESSEVQDETSSLGRADATA